MFDIIQNRRILFGAGKLSELGEVLNFAKGKTVLLVAFSESAKAVADAMSILDHSGI